MSFYYFLLTSLSDANHKYEGYHNTNYNNYGNYWWTFYRYNFKAKNPDYGSRSATPEIIARIIEIEIVRTEFDLLTKQLLENLRY